LQASTASDHDGLATPRRYYAAFAIVVTLVLVVLDGAIANVALPTIAASLRVPPASAIWIVGAYQLALVMVLLPCAALGESYGMRRVFTIGIAIFTLASLFCALSPSLPWLIAARFLQGLGGAAVVSLGIGLMRFTFPLQVLGTWIGWNALVIALSAALGPTIGSAILVVSSWPWLFAINLPIGVLVLISARALPQPPGSGRKIDLPSGALNALAFASLVFAVNYSAHELTVAAALLIVSVVSFAVLIHREMPRHAPLIPLDLLKIRSFRISVIASICCFAGQMTSYIALPFYLLHDLHQSAYLTGLYMMPWPLMVAVAGPLSGRLSDRVSTGLLCAAGGLFLATGLGLAAVWPIHDNLWPLVAFLMLCGLGFGIFQTPNNRNMILSAPKERSGATGGMQGTARVLGETTGSVIMSLLFTLLSQSAAPRIGLAVGATLTLAAGLVSIARIGRN
jgi:DHA2 family multidrug resistance protein-like MFS transporter